MYLIKIGTEIGIKMKMKTETSVTGSHVVYTWPSVDVKVRSSSLTSEDRVPRTHMMAE